MRAATSVGVCVSSHSTRYAWSGLDVTTTGWMAWPPAETVTATIMAKTMMVKLELFNLSLHVVLACRRCLSRRRHEYRVVEKWMASDSLCPFASIEHAVKQGRRCVVPVRPRVHISEHALCKPGPLEEPKQLGRCVLAIVSIDASVKDLWRPKDVFAVNQRDDVAEVCDVGRRQKHPASGTKDAADFSKNDAGIGDGDVFQDLRKDHQIEGVAGERHRVLLDVRVSDPQPLRPSGRILRQPHGVQVDAVNLEARLDEGHREVSG